MIIIKRLEMAKLTGRSVGDLGPGQRQEHGQPKTRREHVAPAASAAVQIQTKGQQ